MIIFADKSYQTRSDMPNTDWTGEALYVVEDGTKIANEIIENYPYYDFVLDADGNLVDVIAIIRPAPEPTLEERLAPILNAMRTERIPSDKIGEDWIVTYLADVELTREYVPSLTPPTEEDGSYLHPFTYELGMQVEEGMWYTDGDDIWEAIANGTPVDFTDKEFFDIIEV